MVDDDPIQLQIREIVLRSAGLDVQLATDVESALALLAQGETRSVWSLRTLPEWMHRRGSGPRTAPHRPSLPVVVLTGMPGIEDEYEGLNVSVWLKPMHPDKFIQVVQGSLSK